MNNKLMDSFRYRKQWIEHRRLMREAYFLYQQRCKISFVARRLNIKYDTAKQWHDEYKTGRLLLRLAKGTQNRAMFADPCLNCWLLVYKGCTLDDLMQRYRVNKTHVIKWMRRGAEMIEWGLEDDN